MSYAEHDSVLSTSTHSCIARSLMTSSTPLLLLKLDSHVPNMILHQLKLEKNSAKNCHRRWSNSATGVWYNFKRALASLQMLIYVNLYGQTSKDLHHALLYKFNTRSYGHIFKNIVLYHFVLNALKMAILKCFWCENALGPQRLNSLVPRPLGQ